MKRRLIDALLMFAVCGFSLALMVYIAEGKANKTYEQFSKDATLALGQLVQSSMEGFLRQDLPLRQFAGFGALTDPLLTEDSPIAATTIVNDRDEIIFTNVQPRPTVVNGKPGDSKIVVPNPSHIHAEDLVLPLRGKFDVAGKIILKTKHHRASARVVEVFKPLWILVLVASAIFAMISFTKCDRTWTMIAFAATFIAVAIAVTIALMPLYADGASAKGRALIATLTGRLDDVTGYGISFEQIDGVDRVFADYRRLNPDIAAIALIIDGKVAEHTDGSRAGSKWEAPEGTYDYVVDITKGGPHQVQVAMALPKGIVYWQIAGSIRNTCALFIASGFFATFSWSLPVL